MMRSRKTIFNHVFQQCAFNSILAKLRVESHFESDPNIAESGPNIVDVESSFASRVNLFLYQS